MKKKSILSLILTAAVLLSGCGGKENGQAPPEPAKDDKKASSVNTGASGKFDPALVSDEYLVGIDYFTGSFLEYAPTVIAKVRYDGRLEAEFDHILSNGDHVTDIVFFDLGDQQYRDIASAIDLKKLYELDPETPDPDEVMDGGTAYLIIYGKDGKAYKSCGGFCPHNKDFNAMRSAVYKNLPDGFREYCDRYKSCWVREQGFVPYYGDPGKSYISTSYGVFLDYDGKLKDLGDYDYLVIDAQYHDKDDIAQIHYYNRYIYSYLNIGSLEDFRTYHDEYADLALGEYEHWEGEAWVDVSDARWQDFILKELAPELLAKGVDGFFVDNCDVYSRYPTAETMNGLAVIMKGLRAMGCDVIINGGDVFLDAYTAQGGSWRDVISGINQECVFTAINWEENTLTPAAEEDRKYFTDYLERYGDQGAYIFMLEYAEDIPENDPLRADIRLYAEKQRYLYYISDSIDLDR